MTGRLHGLELVRGVAALLVAWFHADFIADFPSAASGLFHKAYLAVDLFFLLSGYVLARTYEGRMPRTLDFTRQRYLRLWAPVACGVALGAIYFAMDGMAPGELALNLAAGLAILPLVGLVIPFNPPAWTIFFEIVANMIHAAWLHRISVTKLLAVVAVSALVLLPLMEVRGLDVGTLLGLPRVLLSYCLGVALWRWNRDRVWLPASAALPAVLFYVLALALWPAWLSGAGEIAFVLIVHPLLVLAVLAMGESGTARLLGGLSFPLYALHYPLLLLLVGAGLGWSGALVAAIGAAALLGMAVDPRFRALVLRQFPARAKSAAI